MEEVRANGRKWSSGKGRTGKIAIAAVSSLVATLVAGGVFAAPEPSLPQDAIAVIYSETDQRTMREFDRILIGIESNPNISVYRIELSTAQTVASGASPAGLKVALNGNPSTIAVIYPDIGEPYRSIFSTIIEGIEDKTRTRVASYPVGANANVASVASELKRQNIKVVIALGRNGIRVASELQSDIGVVAGGVIWAPEAKTRAASVISLAPDPALLFGRLKDFFPSTRRVFVVYDPKHNTWLLRLARDAAQALGLELVAYQEPDLRGALRRYQEILATADPKRDALWLPQDSTTVEESSVLPLVLEEAWNRSLVVFSSSVTHVSRGALFALYPNNIELGRNLASSAIGHLNAGPQERHTVTPLQDVLLAFNLRTAGHLGLRLSDRQQRQVDLAFPRR